MRVDNHMHPVALASDPTCGDQIRANRIVLWQVCGEVHLLPLELFAEIVFPWEAEFPKMPTLDEVDLAIPWEGVDFIRMCKLSIGDLIRIGLCICLIVA